MRRIFGYLGSITELMPEELVPVMSGWAMNYTLSEVVLVIADILNGQGRSSISHQAIGSCLRASFHTTYDYRLDNSDPPSLEAVDEALKHVLRVLVTSWREGIIDYLREVGLSASRISVAMGKIDFVMDLLLHIAQMESRGDIKRRTKMAATKGGVLEKALECVSTSIMPFLEEYLQDMVSLTDSDRSSSLQRLVKEASHLVREHTAGMSA